ncbi:pR98 [rat cytomegalovirus strain Maastricht]|uniref:PR98 n=1 Tax=Rat cytomegalovirus (strain Maastricht) TaxID=79700 RepID=Q9DWA2_RCMVM|nr:pR98 [rat cytomegalovirus strain Maastricht]AAF99188.1 pR98 [rat cytomegalovirus strain Maastricht]
MTRPWTVPKLAERFVSAVERELEARGGVAAAGPGGGPARDGADEDEDEDDDSDATPELPGIGSGAGPSEGDDRDERGARDVPYAVFGFGPKRFTRLLRCIERDTRGQAANPVWHALRIDTVSASRFYDVFATSRLSVLGRSGPDPSQPGCEAVRFGMQCEPTVRMLVEEFVVGRRERAGSNVGLLLDPASGVLGASLDFCAGLSEDRDGLLVVGPAARIYEIKCRFKYLRSPDDPAVRDLLERPGLATFAAFILSHPNPAVEYRRSGEAPTGRESLVSHDSVFRPGLKRGRPGSPPDCIRLWLPGLVRRNSELSSVVFVFDALEGVGAAGEDGAAPEADPSLRPPGYLDVVRRATFSAPVFVNPRHPYYCQTLLQQYVLSQYYINAHDDPERMSADELPSVSLVTAILRKRDAREVGKILRINGRPTLCEEIPLCIVVTPIHLDPLFTRDAVNCVLNVWEREFNRRTGLSLWVQSAVSMFVASCAPGRETP